MSPGGRTKAQGTNDARGDRPLIADRPPRPGEDAEIVIHHIDAFELVWPLRTTPMA
jgi:hypothetical protein